MFVDDAPSRISLPKSIKTSDIEYDHKNSLKCPLYASVISFMPSSLSIPFTETKVMIIHQQLTAQELELSRSVVFVPLSKYDNAFSASPLTWLPASPRQSKLSYRRRRPPSENRISKGQHIIKHWPWMALSVGRSVVAKFPCARVGR